MFLSCCVVVLCVVYRRVDESVFYLYHFVYVCPVCLSVCCFPFCVVCVTYVLFCRVLCVLFLFVPLFDPVFPCFVVCCMFWFVLFIVLWFVGVCVFIHIVMCAFL